MELLIFMAFIIVLGLCWGSFLNVVAYRLAEEKDFFITRSFCPSCFHVIHWYDNIPVVSWILLGGKCRYCKEPISLLYPFVEVITALIFGAFFYVAKIENFLLGFPRTSLYKILSGYGISSVTDFGVHFAYLLFFSALIIATRTDLQALVIPQLVTVWLIPPALLFSYFGLLTISIGESMIGAMLGYGVLWLTAYFYKRFTKKDGLGVGDMELLSMIGAFLGPLGVWFSLMVGSISGLIIGGAYLLMARKDRSTHIPFGPFLALGAALYFFFSDYLIHFFIF